MIYSSFLLLETFFQYGIILIKSKGCQGFYQIEIYIDFHLNLKLDQDLKKQAIKSKRFGYI